MLCNQPKSDFAGLEKWYFSSLTRSGQAQGNDVSKPTQIIVRQTRLAKGKTKT